ncbi:MAG: BtrH N-terminal domain-containing protein [Campylobacterales bacterium]|nr:BtrH N-terminal domain-containing protein [Campylobacterales bacterium]
MTFTHTQSAHCESGALSTLLSAYGYPISEPMIFGLTSSLSFAFLPIVKVNGLPLVAYRSLPKTIIKRTQNALHVKMQKHHYTSPVQADAHLRKLLEEGKIVGLQTGVYYLPYFPKEMRFHFNAHNLVVYGVEGDEYLISDPVFEKPVRCKKEDLMRARFAKGAFAPKGFLYYPQTQTKEPNLPLTLQHALRQNAKTMLTPFPYAGVKGMQKLAQKITALRHEPNPRHIKNFLTHIIRMQEEIGTGGGGFRFMYAAFLQEAKAYGLNGDMLDEAQQCLIHSGNTLRRFALACAQASKEPRLLSSLDPSALLQEAAAHEKRGFSLLRKIH